MKPDETKKKSRGRKRQQQHWCCEYDSDCAPHERVRERFRGGAPERRTTESRPGDDRTDHAGGNAEGRGIPGVVGKSRGRGTGDNLAEACEDNSERDACECAADDEADFEPTRRERGVEELHEAMRVFRLTLIGQPLYAAKPRKSSCIKPRRSERLYAILQSGNDLRIIVTSVARVMLRRTAA